MVWETQEKKAVGSVPIVTVEGELPPGPEPEVPPVLPPPGVGLRPAEIKERPEGFIEIHKTVKKEVDKAGYKYLCTTPSKLAEKLSLSLETVLEHLEILQIDEAGKFVQGKSDEDPAFCSIDGLQRLVENLRKLKV
jgi:hypothetical protein